MALVRYYLYNINWIKNALYALVMFYYLAYFVRTSLNTIFLVKVSSAIGVFLSLSFLFDAFLFFSSAFLLAFFFSLYLFGLLLLCIRIRWEGKDLNIRSWRGFRHRNVQLTVREHRCGQVHTHVRDSLALWLVDRHGKAQPDRKLLSLKLEREHLIIRRA